MARAGKAAGAAGGFLKKMLGDLVRPAKKRLGKAGGEAAEHADDAAKRAARGRPDIKMRDADGNPLPTKDLKHPNDDLLDRDALDASRNREAGGDAAKQRSAEGDTPSADRNDPEVQKLTDGYDKDAGGPVDGWPDGGTNPDGFADPDLREPAVLGQGERIDRFGHNFGQYTSPAGEPYAARALPDSNLDAGYRQFEVTRDLPVWRGDAAPAQGQLGGATQHYLPYPVVDLVNGGYLRQVYPPTS